MAERREDGLTSSEENRVSRKWEGKRKAAGKIRERPAGRMFSEVWRVGEYWNSGAGTDPRR